MTEDKFSHAQSRRIMDTFELVRITEGLDAACAAADRAERAILARKPPFSEPAKTAGETLSDRGR